MFSTFVCSLQKTFPSPACDGRYHIHARHILHASELVIRQARAEVHLLEKASSWTSSIVAELVRKYQQACDTHLWFAFRSFNPSGPFTSTKSLLLCSRLRSSRALGGLHSGAADKNLRQKAARSPSSQYVLPVPATVTILEYNKTAKLIDNRVALETMVFAIQHSIDRAIRSTKNNHDRSQSTSRSMTRQPIN